jgi:DNA-binding NarL/FixJ family response regulator
MEDEPLSRNLIAHALVSEGWIVVPCESVAQAVEALTDGEPNALVCDLDMGPGPTGVDLCQWVAEVRPWIAIVVLTAHTSPLLAVASLGGLLPDVVYLVKSTVSSSAELSAAIDAAITGRYPEGSTLVQPGMIELSAEQSEVLRLVAQAYSNAAIAEQRGTSLRAAEAMVQRVFAALGIEQAREANARVKAAKLWDSGRIIIR